MNRNELAASFIINTKFESLPPEVIKQAKRCLLDLLGASLGGVKTKGVEILSSFCSQEMTGPLESTVIKGGKKVSCVVASLINGFIANALDVDDGYRKIKGHPGAAVFPTTLAVAEKKKADGKQFLEALIIGYEIAIRAGLILHSSYQAYHGSGSWGAVGAAAAAAKLLNLTKNKIKHALGIAEAHAPLAPVMRAVDHPSMAPKDGIAWGAMVGTTSALLAQKGFTGISSLLSDERKNSCVFTLGKEYEMMNLYFKRYPCCRWAHPAIDGVLNIMKDNKITHHEISRIIIKTFLAATRLRVRKPTSIEEAEYSIFYPIAAASVDGEFGLKQLDKKHLNNNRVSETVKKIQIVSDQKLEEKFPEQCLAEVKIITYQNKEYTSGIISAKGDLDNPLSDHELKHKFVNFTQGVLSKTKANKLIDMVEDFENHRVRELTELVT